MRRRASLAGSLVGTLLLLLGAPARLAAEEAPGAVPQPLLCDPKEHEKSDCAHDAIGAKLKELLAARRFAEADEEVARLAKLGRVPGHIETHLRSALEDLAAARHLAPAEAWCAARPESAAAHLVRGEVLVDHAWVARGTGWGYTVSEEGARLFRERLERARGDLERVRTLAPTWTAPYMRLITCAMGLGRPEAEARALCDRSLALDPADVSAPLALLAYLQPKWRGSLEAMWAHARGLVKRFPKDPAYLSLLQEAHEELLPRGGADYLADPDVRSELVGALSGLREAFPHHWRAPTRLVLVARALKDRKLELALLRSMSAQGQPKAQSALAQKLLYVKDDPGAVREGLHWLCKAAHGGAVWAEERLCTALVHGRFGLAKDRGTAVVWGKRAALQGKLDMAMFVAESYYNGLGVPQDYAQARHWIRFAAERKHPQGLYEYGLMLFRGRGGPQDVEGGLRYLDASVAAGFMGAQWSRGMLLVNEGRLEAGVALLRKAAAQGLKQAEVDLRKVLEKHPELRRDGDPD